jgi:hypothetical protein
MICFQFKFHRADPLSLRHWIAQLNWSNPAPEPSSLICFHRQSNALSLLSFWIFTVHWKIFLYFTAQNSPSIVLCVTMHGSLFSFSPASAPYGLSPHGRQINSLDLFRNFPVLENLQIGSG